MTRVSLFGTLRSFPRPVLIVALAAGLAATWACGGGGTDDAAGAGGSSAGGSGLAGSSTSGAGGASAAGSSSAGSGTAGSGTAGSGTAGSGTAGSGTAGSNTAGSGTAGTTQGGKVVSAKASPIDGWFQTGLPLEAPGHLYVSAMDAAGKATTWPAGTTFTATGGDCVYAKAFGPRVLLFAKASCPENVSVTATTPDGVVSTSVTIKTYAQPSPKIVDAWVMPDSVPPPVYAADFASEKGLALLMGTKGHASLRVRFAASGNLPEYSSILSPEELTSLEATAPLSIDASGAVVAGPQGTGTVTATFSLPKPGMPGSPYLLKASFPLSVVGELPVTTLWIKPDDDTAGASTLSVEMGGPCRKYHLVTRHSDASASYYVERSWSEAALVWGSTAYGALDDQGNYCSVAPGQTDLSVSLLGMTQKLLAEVRPPMGQSFSVRIDPDPVVVTAVGAAGCVELHVFAKLPGGTEEDITSNPTVKPYAVPKPDPKALPPTWATCGRQPDGKLTCCSNGSGVIGSDGKTYGPSELPGLVSVYYAGGGGSAELSSK